MYIYAAIFTPRNPEPEEAPVWEVALGWTDPRECHRGSWAALTRSLEQTLPPSKRPPHLRKCELCFQLSCCACGQHAREWGLNFASFCKGLNNKKRAVSPFKVINRMKVLLQPVAVLLRVAALALGAHSQSSSARGFLQPSEKHQYFCYMLMEAWLEVSLSCRTVLIIMIYVLNAADLLFLLSWCVFDVQLPEEQQPSGTETSFEHVHVCMP